MRTERGRQHSTGLSMILSQENIHVHAQAAAGVTDNAGLSIIHELPNIFAYAY